MAFTGETADENQNESFEAALAKAKRGKNDGYRLLYDTYNRVIAAVVLAEGCPNPDETVNAVFLKAFRSIDRFVGGSPNFASFLYQITRFQITDETRARNRMAEGPESQAVEPVQPGLYVTETDPSQPGDLSLAGPGHHRTEHAVQTQEALKALTAEQREVMVLRIFFGLTGPETAEALDKPVAAIRSLQNRAEARLRATAEAGSVML